MNCFDCHQDFDSSLALTRHKVEKHILLRAFICKLCNKLITEEVPAKTHILEKHLNASKEEINLLLSDGQDEGSSDPETQQALFTSTPRIASRSQGLKRQPEISPIAYEGSDSKKDCQVCSVGFASKQDLEAHVARDHSDSLADEPSARKRPRALSEDRSNPKKARAEPMKKSSNLESKSFQCSTCHKEFALNMQLKKHNCPGSGQVSSNTHSSTEVKGELEASPLDTMYSCPHCDEQYHFEQLREQHIQVQHNGKDKYRCHVVGKLCQVKYRGFPSSLQRHIVLKHMRELCEFVSGLTQCGSCDMSIAKSKDYDLSVHMVTKHPEVVKSHITADPKVPFRCGQCPKTFYYEQMLRQHVAQLHEQDEGDACVFCEKKFNDLNKMEFHVACIHMKEELHLLTMDSRLQTKCLSCPLEYNTSLDLAKHMLLRHKKDTYYILQSIKISNSGSQVKLKTEMGAKVEQQEGLSPRDDQDTPYIDSAEMGEIRCTEEGCEQRFHFKLLMERHRAIEHQDIAGIKCHVCDAEYDTPSATHRHFLESHMNNYIKALPCGRTCPVCGKQLSCTKSKRMHLFKEHPFQASEILRSIVDASQSTNSQKAEQIDVEDGDNHMQ